MTGRASWRPLKAILGGLVDVPEDIEVADLTQDSRAVKPGALFLACRGQRQHGVSFAAAAAAAGARAVLWEPAPGVAPPALPAGVYGGPVPDLGRQLGYLADRFFDAPSATLRVIGITGTNGKTTCAWLLAQALTRCGVPCGYIGTLGVADQHSRLRELSHTTPDAISVQRLLAELRDTGCRAVAMEASSHALEQDRLAGVRFAVSAFTNLTRDHLDYHGDMRAYAAAKARLLDWPTLTARVINVDDATGAGWARERLGERRAADVLVTTARAQTAREFTAQWPQARRFVRVQATRAEPGIELDVSTATEGATLASRLRGAFNVENLATVLGALQALDLPLRDAVAALAACEAPPGRMQAEGGGVEPLVFVDYAHTPDALAKLLQAARPYCRGQLACVFGCGGDRDRGKRAQMGRIAAELADVLVVTDDNPRGERPELITEDIMQGIAAAGGAARARVVHDRAQAIRTALAGAQTGDVVVVAGKGHENYQLVGAERRPFNDASEVRRALASRSAA